MIKNLNQAAAFVALSLASSSFAGDRTLSIDGDNVPLRKTSSLAVDLSGNERVVAINTPEPFSLGALKALITPIHKRTSLVNGNGSEISTKGAEQVEVKITPNKSTLFVKRAQ